MARRSRPPKPQRTDAEHADLIRRAEAYDIAAMAELCDEPHDIDEVGFDPGDLGAQAEHDLMRVATPDLTEFARLSLYLKQMRTELDGPTPSPIERLLVDRVVTCWLHVSYLETRWVQSWRGDAKAREHVDRLLGQANRRYVAAIKTLAVVRRLAIPVVQMNLASQQVNLVAGSTGPGAGTPS